jgi:hypothetical protein
MGDRSAGYADLLWKKTIFLFTLFVLKKKLSQPFEISSSSCHLFYEYFLVAGTM